MNQHLEIRKPCQRAVLGGSVPGKSGRHPPAKAENPVGILDTVGSKTAGQLIGW